LNASTAFCRISCSVSCSAISTHSTARPFIMEGAASRLLPTAAGSTSHTQGVRCNEMPYLAFAKALIVEPCYPAISRASLCIVVEALASEFNFSHIHIWFYRLSPFPSITPRSYR
jgi:hypothetical protein